MTDRDSTTTPASLLVVDDDRTIRDLIARSLTLHGYRVRTAASVAEMEQALAEAPAELILLDIMMPGESGLSACERLVRHGGPTVVFLSALGEEEDRITGLDIGASHYLPKPCSTREILATVRAALRRRGGEAASEREAYRFAGWEIDFSCRELHDPEGVLVDLTDGEFDVLRVFVRRPRRVLSRDVLLDGARGADSAAFDRAIDVQVSRLRRKLRAPNNEIIRTVRNEGYMLVPPVTRA